MMDVTEVSAVIFDCDGVLVDSETMSCNALNVIFDRNFGIDIGNDYSDVLGKSVAYAIQFYSKKHNIHIEQIDDLVAQKENTYFKLAENHLQSFPNIKEFLEYLTQENILRIVASSGSRKKIEFSLAQVKLRGYFQALYSTEIVVNGKPAPDLLNLITKEMNLQSNQCLVIEDSLAGVNAALNANMRVVAFPGTFPEHRFTELGVPYVRNGYRELIDWFSNRH